MSTFRNGRVLAAVTALSFACLLGSSGPAAAHAGSSANDRKDKRQQFLDGVSVPVASSPNIRFVGNFPDTAAISGVHAISAPYFYVSSTDSISVYDTSDPVHPRLTGTLPNLVFENEAMNYGEQTIDGVINRFVLVGADTVEYSPTDPSHVGRSNEVMVVDVTDPAHPRIRSRVKTTTNTHTVSCIHEAACRYAYTAGRNGKVSIASTTPGTACTPAPAVAPSSTCPTRPARGSSPPRTRTAARARGTTSSTTTPRGPTRPRSRPEPRPV
ncbi:MAG: hypothetical protein ABJA93_07950 [Sporichthyaceae bacterium]